ncbi:hypothetical protein B0H17DRAFT_1140373 [Mycena rosella]|uniref:Uncharacterized protein n=1 Tax=Mycena rosella TaxID=1033263 RepID=A0AAD7D263_MYCRO|nr:hypothetical protein B0H17DRAFT_1140373 [Mycena rosella]
MHISYDIACTFGKRQFLNAVKSIEDSIILDPSFYDDLPTLGSPVANSDEEDDDDGPPPLESPDYNYDYDYAPLPGLPPDARYYKFKAFVRKEQAEKLAQAHAYFISPLLLYFILIFTSSTSASAHDALGVASLTMAVRRKRTGDDGVCRVCAGRAGKFYLPIWLTDGENPERAWSMLDPASRSAKDQPAGRVLLHTKL